MENGKRVHVRLSKAEQQELDKLLRGGLQPVRTVLPAMALSQLADGQAIRTVARNVGLTPKTVWLTSRPYRSKPVVTVDDQLAVSGWHARVQAPRGRSR